MLFLTVHGQTHNLAYLLRYVLHEGQREIGATGSLVDPEPIFGPFRYAELIFRDGTRITLDGPQTEAFLKEMRRRGHFVDLDAVDEKALGHVIVHDTDEGGDIILPRSEFLSESTRADQETGIPEDLVDEGE